LRRLAFRPCLEQLEDRITPVSGPRVLSLTPTQVINATFDHVDVQFNEAIDPNSFDLQDLAITGPSAAVVPTGIDQVSVDTFRVRFAALTERGTYRIAVGPNVADLAGNLMNQNQNGINGEAVADRFTASLVYINANVIFTSSVTVGEGDSTYDGKDLLIDGTTVAIDGPHSFNSVHLVNGAVLTHSPVTNQAHSLNLTVTERLLRLYPE